MGGWKLKDLDSSLVIDLKNGDVMGRSEGTYKFPECSKMSRQHCKFILENNFAYILDLNSRNGTYVNSLKSDPEAKVLLGNGHILMIGEKTFMVKGGEDSTAANKSMIPGVNLEPQRAHSALSRQQTSAPVKTYEFNYKAGMGEFAVLLIKNLLFTVLTLGIYLPYARTNLRKFIWKSTTLNNSPFMYKADPKSLLKSYLILAVVFGVFYGASLFLSQMAQKQGMGAAMALGVVNYIAFFLFVMKISYNAYAFMVNHTSYRSIKFQVSKAGSGEHFKTSLIGTLLCYVTLGLYYPFLRLNQETVKWKNTRYGTIPFKFKANNKDYALLWYKGFFLSVITLGLYTPWFLVGLHNHKVKLLSIGGAKFKSSATGLGYCKVFTKCFLLVLVTLGLASPFIMNFHLTFFLENLSLTGAIDFDQVTQGESQKQSGMADAIADVFDLDVDVG